MPARVSFREHMLRVREDSIVATATRLLAAQGYETTTMDQVAAEVGIAKASLYKHFSSKELLAAAVALRLVQRTLARMDEIDGTPAALQAMLRWAVERQLAGELPAPPAARSPLQAALLAHAALAEALAALDTRLDAWITAAQHAGSLRADLPAAVLRHLLLLRACDPLPGLLKVQGHADAQIADWLQAACFGGLQPQPASPQLVPSG